MTKPRRLMRAERLAKIARELVYVAPGAPWFLTLMLDKPVDSPLGLDMSATASAERSPMFKIESAAGTTLRVGFATEAEAQAALELDRAGDLRFYGNATDGLFANAEVVPA